MERIIFIQNFENGVYNETPELFQIDFESVIDEIEEDLLNKIEDLQSEVQFLGEEISRLRNKNGN
jgi:hypothetical protein